MNAMVEPLPLVPATWMVGGSRRCGSPSAARMCHIRSSDRSMRFGCNAVSRATMESMALIFICRRDIGLARGAMAGRAKSDDGCLSRALKRQVVRGRLWPCLGQEPAEICKRRPEMVSMHDHVDHPMVLEIFGPLKAIGQLLADGLLDHPRSGETDERARFRNMDVAEHGIGRGDAASGRIGEYDDVRPPCLAQHLHRKGGPRQLHQRENSLLHARASRSCEYDEGGSLVDRGFEALDDCFARRHAERAAHEIEILHSDHHRHALELAETELDGIVGASLGSR